MKTIEQRIKECKTYMKENPLPENISYSNRYETKIIGEYIFDLFIKEQT